MSSIAGLIKKASDLGKQPPLVVVFAEPGAGKTTNICEGVISKKHPERSLVIDFDNSAIVIERVRPEARVIQPEDFTTVEQVLHAIRTGDPVFDDLQNLIIDTMSTGEDVLLWQSMAAKGKRVPEISNYNERHSVLRQFIRDLKILRKNIFVVCHEMEMQLEEDNLHDLGTAISITRKMPKLAGKLSSSLCGMADIVLRLAIKEDVDENGNRIRKRVYQTQKTDRVWAKDRTGLLPGVMDANMREVMKAWHKLNGYGEKANNQKQEEPADEAKE